MHTNLKSSLGARANWSDERTGFGVQSLTARPEGIHGAGDRHVLALAIQLIARQRLTEIELLAPDTRRFAPELHFTFYSTGNERTPTGLRYRFDLVLSCGEGQIREVRSFHVDIQPSGSIHVCIVGTPPASQYFTVESLIDFCRTVQADLNRGCAAGLNRGHTPDGRSEYSSRSAR